MHKLYWMTMSRRAYMALGADLLMLAGVAMSLQQWEPWWLLLLGAGVLMGFWSIRR